MNILKLIKNIFNKQENKDVMLIDFRNSYWGHSIVFDKTNEDNSFEVYGWHSPVPEKGDEFLHKFKKGIGVCIFMDVKPCDDPKDMFFANAGLIRYATQEDYDKLNKPSDGLGFKILR